MMRPKTYVCVLALTVIVLSLQFNARASGKHKTAGRVIARDVYISLPRTSSTVNVDVFVLRTNDSIKSRGTSTRFIKVRYEDLGNQHPLPTDLLEGKNLWRFSLTRDRSCDQVVSEGLIARRSSSNELPKPGTFVLLESADVNDVPALNSTMPCFTVRPGGVKPVSGQP